MADEKKVAGEQMEREQELTIEEQREVWRRYWRSVAHCYSDATTPGFFKLPEPPPFPEPRAASTPEAAGLSEERITEIAHALWDELDDGNFSVPWDAPGKHQSNIRRWYRRYARAAVKVLSAPPSGEQGPKK